MSGPVRESDEMLPADAARGAGRTPARRSASLLLGFFSARVTHLPSCTFWRSPHNRPDNWASPQFCSCGLASALQELSELQNRPLAGVPGETAAEHIQNALQIVEGMAAFVVDKTSHFADRCPTIRDEFDKDLSAIRARLRAALAAL